MHQDREGMVESLHRAIHDAKESDAPLGVVSAITRIAAVTEELLAFVQPRDHVEDLRHTFHLGDGDTLQVVVTNEGVILDAFRNDEHVGTRADLAVQLFDDLAGE